MSLITRLGVRIAGSLIGRRPGLNFIPGANVTLSGADNPSSGRVDLTISATGTLSGSDAAVRTTVAAPGTSAGATSVPVASVQVGAGQLVAVGALGTKCEIRRVKSGSSSTSLVVNALNLPHAAGENVFVLTGYYAPLEWWLCRAGDLAYDSWQGMQQAFNDLASQGAGQTGGWGLQGRGSLPYYVSKPVAWYDYSDLDNIAINTGAPGWAFDAMTGKRGTISDTPGTDPDQFVATIGGQFGTLASVNTTTNVLTLSSDPGGPGDKIIFYPLEGSTLPAPLEAGRAYYNRDYTGVSMKVSVDQFGTAVDITTSGTGTIVWYSPGLARLRARGLLIHGGNVQGMNGLLAQLQQPSYCIGLRVEACPGPRGALVVGGQEAQFYSTELFNNKVNLRCSNALMFHFFGTNTEIADYGIILEGDGVVIPSQGGSQATGNVIFSGGHAESTYDFQNSVQRVLGNASVTAGTYTLTFRGQTTAAIAYNASAAAVQSALEALSLIADSGADITCTAESGGTPAGNIRVTFTNTGQYAYRNMTAQGYLLTINTAGLTGGVYTLDDSFPEKRIISHREGLGIAFRDWLTNSGTSFYTSEIGTFSGIDETTMGVVLESIFATGQFGYAVDDKRRSFTILWADNTDGGAAQVIDHYRSGGWHGQFKHAGYWISPQLVYEDFTKELRVLSGKLRFGHAGPSISSGAGTPEGFVTAPIGSLYVNTSGSTSTTLYVKTSGAGNTGWTPK